jgi:hypothetical protein
MDGWGRCRAQGGVLPELDGDADRRGRPISGRSEGAMYPFEKMRSWAVGHLWGWVERLPAAFSFFLFFFFFLFLISYFFYNFCKKASKQFKPISKFF